MEDTNADKAKLELAKLPDSTEALDITKTISEIVEYGKAGYSSVIARGTKGEEEKIFNSKKSVPSRRASVARHVKDDAKWNKIMQELRKFVNETFK